MSTVAASPVRRILTPEHVEVRLTPAGPGSRFLALVVDSLFATGLAGLATRFLGPVLPPGLSAPLFATLNFVLSWGYHVFFEVLQRGQPPGKRLFGLRVVDGRGLPLTVEQSFVRNVVRVLDFAPVFYGVGAGVALLDPYRRRLGDLVADTLVVQEARASAAEIAAQAARKEAPGLRTPALSRRIRQRLGVEDRELLAHLLLRADALEPRARFDLFEEIGEHFRRRLEIDDRTLSGENLVRGVAAVLWSDRRAAKPARVDRARADSASIPANR